MALPMLKEIIQTVHRLAAACKKHKGMVFIDKNGNIIQDNSPEDNSPEEDDSDGPYNSEITGVITGVDKTTGNTHKQMRTPQEWIQKTRPAYGSRNNKQHI